MSATATVKGTYSGAAFTAHLTLDHASISGDFTVGGGSGSFSGSIGDGGAITGTIKYPTTSTPFDPAQLHMTSINFH